MSSLLFLLLTVSVSSLQGLMLPVLALMVGAALGILYGRRARHEASAAASARGEAALAEMRAERDALRAEAGELRVRQATVGAELAGARERQACLEGEARAAGERYEATGRELREAREACARVEVALAAERANANEKVALLVGAREELTNQFKAAANEILEDKSKRFTEHNRNNMDQLLGPLREKLGEFQLKVEGLHQEGVVGRTELRTQIEALRGMNDKLSTDANNLVKALKGSSKTQGDWGEVLLVGILEAAGLRQGREYRVQQTFATEEGRHVRPDIILDLPQRKHLVIDSKVSLNSYTEYCACDDDESRKGFLDRHARSVRDHVDGLSKKAYQGLHQLQSLDFVIMFIPIEPAYMLALAHDGSLWERAWNKDVLLVSPGTLYPILRTIQYAWQQERQSRNVEEIVRQGGALYDKMAMFAAGFEDMGRKIAGAHTAYDKAWAQLASGRGNVLTQFEKLRELGIRNAKSMPAALVGGDREESGVELGEIAGSAELLPLLEAEPRSRSTQ